MEICFLIGNYSHNFNTVELFVELLSPLINFKSGLPLHLCFQLALHDTVNICATAVNYQRNYPPLRTNHILLTIVSLGIKIIKISDK